MSQLRNASSTRGSHALCVVVRAYYSSSSSSSSQSAAELTTTTTTTSSRSSPSIIHPLQLGSLQLSSNVILSPLERVSDVGFRQMCHANGAALTWTEMVYGSELIGGTATSSRTTLHEQSKRVDQRGAALIDTYDAATPTGVQLLIDRTTRRDDWGVDLLKRCLEHLEKGAAATTCNQQQQQHSHWSNICAVDLNFGCPSPDISRRGCGPAQLRRRSKMRSLFQYLVEWRQQQTTLPNLGAVGAKMRLGNTAREQDFKVYLPVAEAAADVGLDYLTVHARHGDQRSSAAITPRDWQCVREMSSVVRSSSSTKILANGDIRTHEDIQRVTELTNCHGVMIGRAAMRNPWCFESLITGAPEVWPTIDQVEEAYRKHGDWPQKSDAAHARYLRFREENFERLRRMARTSNNTSSSANSCNSSNPPSNGTDWYQEWSQAAHRRRHLDQVADGEEPGDRGSRRRTSNSRAWNQERKRKKL